MANLRRRRRRRRGGAGRLPWQQCCWTAPVLMPKTATARPTTRSQTYRNIPTGESHFRNGPSRVHSEDVLRTAARSFEFRRGAHVETARARAPARPLARAHVPLRCRGMPMAIATRVLVVVVSSRVCTFAWSCENRQFGFGWPR